MALLDSLTPTERRAAKKKKPTGLKRHELSACYPDLDDAKLAALAKSINDDGQQKPIELFCDEVLDGWQRYRACLLAKVEPWTTDVTSELNGQDAGRYVEILNGDSRRHLSVKDRAIAAAKLSETKYYKNRAKEAFGKRNDLTYGSKEPEVSDQATVQAAKSVGASVASTKRAAKVLKDGAKATVKALEDDKISLNKAAEIANLKKEMQPKAVKEATKKQPKNGSTKPTKHALFRACEKSFGELYRTALKLGLDGDKFGEHFDAIIGEINRLGGKE